MFAEADEHLVRDSVIHEIENQEKNIVSFIRQNQIDCGNAEEMAQVLIEFVPCLTDFTEDELIYAISYVECAVSLRELVDGGLAEETLDGKFMLTSAGRSAAQDIISKNN